MMYRNMSTTAMAAPARNQPEVTKRFALSILYLATDRVTSVCAIRSTRPTSSSRKVTA